MSLIGAQELEEAIRKQIDYHAQEFDMSTAEIVGVLEIVKTDFLMDSIGDEEVEGSF